MSCVNKRKVVSSNSRKKGGRQIFRLLNGTRTFYLNHPDLNLFLTASTDYLDSLAVEVSEFLSLRIIL
jgi:hypothetical protein